MSLNLFPNDGVGYNGCITHAINQSIMMLFVLFDSLWVSCLGRAHIHAQQYPPNSLP